MKREHRITLIVGLFYLVYILLFLSKFDFNPSATIELSENHISQYNEALPSDLVVQVDSDGFDGQFYYMIATDPIHSRILVEPGKYQRILYPLFANAISFGNIHLIPYSLLLINFVAVILGTYILALILKKYRANLNLAYLWAFNVGFFMGVIRDLTSPLMFFFILLAIYYLEKKYFRLSSLFFAFALLTRETALWIIGPLLLYFLMKHKFKLMIIYSMPLIIFFTWQLVIFLKFEAIAIFNSGVTLTLPLIGLIKYISWLDFPKSLSEFYTSFSIIPVILFSIMVGYIVLKRRNLTLYSTILLFQILFIFILEFRLYTESIDALGRYAMSIFLFSILFTAEKKRKYSIILALLIMLMSTAFFIEKIIRFKVEYFVT